MSKDSDASAGVEEAHQSLTALAADPQLAQLDRLLGKWNVFEVAGMTTKEVRHSDFLAFLLDPSRPHQLGDRFLKAFLHHAAAATDSSGLAADRGLEAARVHRENARRDILIEGPQRQWVIVVENKTGSEEHGEQLRNYFATTER